MIAIYAKAGDRRAAELCAALRERSVPCGMVGPEYGSASMIHKVPFLFIGAGCETMIECFHNAIPDHKIIRSYEMLCPEKLLEQLKNVYGLDFLQLSGSGIRFVEDQLYFFGNRISLTDCEKSILKLLLLCRGTYFTADEIAAFCLLRCRAYTQHQCEKCSNRHRAYRLFQTILWIQSKIKPDA